ncbi:MAG: hypothetical protein HGB10_06720 [Coriobacteriia bacterium]|nr:hypothetical protein [Coriobacteriia bacterium]
MSVDDIDVRQALADPPPAPPGERLWVWAVSAAAVIVIGALSATSGARVPLLWFVDFGVHEFGHMVFMWAPWTVTAAAGSISQVALPLGLAAYFAFARRELWAAAPLLAWAGASARNAAVYIADAPYQRLQLWGGEGSLHDWAQLLQGKPMMLAEEIAWTVNAVGWLAIAGALAMALVQIVRIVRLRRAAAADLARHATLPVREPRGPIG